MTKCLILLLFTIFLVSCSADAHHKPERKLPQARTANGIVQGVNDSGVLIFKGIPYAQPPTGDLRWKPPQPVKNWSGILKADHFGPRCMQHNVYGDMIYRSDGMSEDCLYLNIWTPVKPKNLTKKHLPVLVYFYGGGFIAGDGSEPRYDGEHMARSEDIIAITVNYRLGVFGFLVLPGLAKESPHHAAGDYGLLDQVQALRWIKKNIAAFGGDPSKITIAGESAGSMSVSALMASPLSRNLFRGAIGESGSMLTGPFSTEPSAKAEQSGKKFEKMVGVHSLAALRAMPADSLLKASMQRSAPRFPVTVDGYFLPKSPLKIYEVGKQADVPLLLGWNSEEASYKSLMGDKKPTPENFVKTMHQLYGSHADSLLKYYPHQTKKQTIRSATDLAGARFTLFSTWKWGYMQRKTGTKPVYRYYYSHPRPATGPVAKVHSAQQNGAVHSAEIQYVMGNLFRYIDVYQWTPQDYKVSHIFMGYVANFVKTGNPNGPGLPHWEALNRGKTPHFMHIDVNTRQEPVKYRKRHLYLNRLSKLAQ
jgi:para-nitrobenzyl esterase